MEKDNIPLVVDLDGTLIRTDLLLESFYAMVKKKPILMLNIPFWLLRGKAYLKNQIAMRAQFDIKLLPYNVDFLAYLQNQHIQGREISLATASTRDLAEKIARHLGIFSDVMATEGIINLSGKNKLKAIFDKYGEKGFDYAGNGAPDLHIFPHARNVILVDPSRSILKTAKKISVVQQVFAKGKANLFTYFKAMRIFQWVKNILLFVPLVTSHKWGDINALAVVILGFISFSICASGGYLFNDFLDLSSDRCHPSKKNRPFASGKITLLTGSILMVMLKIIGLGVALFLGWEYFGLLLLYSFVTFLYSIRLKTYVLIDVLVLAGLYTLRVMVGAVLIGVSLSFWLLAFSMFIFFSLALVKRCSELITASKRNKEHVTRRDYGVIDLDHLREMGITSGYLAILIVAFYINSVDVTILYSRPKILWLICPVLLYWVSRIWLKTGRGEMTDDPIVFSVKDRGTRYVVIAIALTIIFAI